MVNQVVPSTPIIADDRGDISVYPSVIDACIEMEAIDVDDDVYEVFDGRGYPLTLETTGEEIRMRIALGTVARPAELLGRLTEFVERVGPENFDVSAIESSTLPELLAAVELFQNRK